MKTTLEDAREKTHKEIVDALQGLVEKNHDAEKGFKKAMEDVKHASLKTFLSRQAVQRNRFVTELEYELRQLDAQPKEDDGSISGSIHRAWIDLKAAVTGHDAENVLEECIRGEKASVKEYDEVLKNHTLPLNISNVVTKQRDEINNTLNRIKTLEDLAD